MIDGKAHRMSVGESIIILEHSPNMIKAKVRFKMISTVIKSGYEGIGLDGIGLTDH